MKPTVLITGAAGLIGGYLVRTAARWAPQWEVRGVTRAEADLTDSAQVQELRRRHEDEWWPTDLTITDEAGKELEGHAWLAEGMPAYCRPVISAPLQAGLAAGSNRTIGKPSLLALRRVRTFDPVWFEFAHALGFTFAAAQRLPPRS